MDRVLLTIALVAAAIAAYPLVVYPVLVRILAWIRPRPWSTGSPAFDVAHVITVHNEAGRIRTKLENALAARYPTAGAELIVASDGSTDETEKVVAEFAGRGVRWLPCPRQGKEFAQLAAIRATRAPVIVFSDASTSLEPGSVESLLAPFADGAVGAVSGMDVVEGLAHGGEETYVRYEMGLRRAESLAGSLVGLSGCFFAVRREIAAGLKTDVPSDLGAALVCLAVNRRAVHAQDARCVYSTTPSVEKEFARKRRTALRGLRGLLAHPRAFSFRRPVATWELVSHKVLRFLSPVFLALSVACVVAAAALGNEPAILISIAAGIVLTIAAVSLMSAAARRFAPLRALGFLLLGHAAVATALVDLTVGRKAVHWVPTRRG